MSDAIEIDVRGLEALQADLRRLDKQFGGDAVSNALYAGALVLEGQAKMKCERMGAVDTGFLVNSIFSTGLRATTVDAARAESFQRASDRGFLDAPPRRENYAYVSIGAAYGIYVEMGTHKMAARPFMRKTVDENGKDAISAIRQNVDDMIERVWAA